MFCQHTSPLSFPPPSLPPFATAAVAAAAATAAAALIFSRFLSLFAFFLLLDFSLYSFQYSVPSSIFYLAPLPPPTLPPIIIVTRAQGGSSVCPSGQLPCGDGGCFVIGRRCDGRRDCVSTGVDELGCGAPVSPPPPTLPPRKSRKCRSHIKWGFF